jgi:hypothetical protein
MHVTYRLPFSVYVFTNNNKILFQNLLLRLEIGLLSVSRYEEQAQITTNKWRNGSWGCADKHERARARMKDHKYCKQRSTTFGIYINQFLLFYFIFVNVLV